MGVELQPRFQPRIPGLIYEAEGKALIDDLEELEAIAAEQELTPLSAYMDPREPPEDFEPDEDFDGDPESYVEQVCGPWTDWFSAREGEKAVHALLMAVREPASQERLSDAETVLHDLEALERCLKVAAGKQAKFRLEVA